MKIQFQLVNFVSIKSLFLRYREYLCRCLTGEKTKTVWELKSVLRLTSLSSPPFELKFQLI